MSARIFRVDGIRLQLEPYHWAYAEAHDEAIDEHWRLLSAGNESLFDGRVLLMHRHAVVDDVLQGACFETAFSRFLAWRDFGFPDLAVRNVFGMAALRGSDGAYIVGEMGPRTSNAGQCYFPAGTPDLDDVREGMVDLDGSVTRELLEETGLRADEVRSSSGWIVVERGPRIACLRLTILKATAAEAASAIAASLSEQIEPELSAVHVVADMEQARALRMPDFMYDFFADAFGSGDQPG
ncbi:MAG: hydrolase [Hyphomicrobiales bacterium]|nr:hydrolase [Hyphomicrobiales bacterium]